MDYNFNYVRLLVSNYRDSVRFYRDVLEMPMILGDLESGYAEFQAPGIRLALFQRSEMSKALGLQDAEEEGRRHVALAFAVEDVDRAFAELEAKGARFTLAPRTHSDWNLRTAHLQDPDGNLIEINQRLS